MDMDEKRLFSTCRCDHGSRQRPRRTRQVVQVQTVSEFLFSRVGGEGNVKGTESIFQRGIRNIDPLTTLGVIAGGLSVVGCELFL